MEIDAVLEELDDLLYAPEVGRGANYLIDALFEVAYPEVAWDFEFRDFEDVPDDSKEFVWK